MDISFASSAEEHQETVLNAHEHADGYWYIGAGRSIADGPYRNAQQLLSVASDLLADKACWRIELFDRSGAKLVSYSSEQVSAVDLQQRVQRRWTPPASPLDRTPNKFQ
jgi:hypothetical protein